VEQLTSLESRVNDCVNNIQGEIIEQPGICPSVLISNLVEECGEAYYTCYSDTEVAQLKLGQEERIKEALTHLIEAESCHQAAVETVYSESDQEDLNDVEEDPVEEVNSVLVDEDLKDTGDDPVEEVDSFLIDEDVKDTQDDLLEEVDSFLIAEDVKDTQDDPLEEVDNFLVAEDVKDTQDDPLEEVDSFLVAEDVKDTQDDPEIISAIEIEESPFVVDDENLPIEEIIEDSDADLNDELDEEEYDNLDSINLSEESDSEEVIGQTTGCDNDEMCGLENPGKENNAGLFARLLQWL